MPKAAEPAGAEACQNRLARGSAGRASLRFGAPVAFVALKDKAGGRHGGRPGATGTALWHGSVSLSNFVAVAVVGKLTRNGGRRTLDMSVATADVGTKFTPFGRPEAGAQNMWHMVGLWHSAHEVE